MTETKPSIRQAVRALGAAAENALSDHPSHETLGAYCRGELDEARSREIEEHLAWCPDDAEFVLAYRDLTSRAPLGVEVQDEADEAWRSFRDRVAWPHPAPEGQRTTGTLPGQRLLTWSLAASLLVAATTTGFLASYKHRYEKAIEPRVDSQIVDLGVADEERAAGAEPKEVRLGSRQSAVSLILHPTELPGAGSYSVRLLGPDGRDVWNGAAAPTEVGTFQLTLVGAFLRDEGYTLELRREVKGEVEVLDRFPVRFVLAERP